MKREAQIAIISHQYIDGDVNRSETRADGFVAISGNKISVCYSDDLGDGTETDCEIVLDDPLLIIKRKGCVKTTLEIEENVCHKSIYKTLYGEFPIEITGKKLTSNLKENKLEITAYYYLVLGGGDAVLNKVKITVWYGDTVNE